MKYRKRDYATNAVVNYKDLESFLAYLEDKTEDVYKEEVQQAIERFLTDEITTMTDDIIK